MQNVDLILKVDGANCSIATDSGGKGSTPVVKVGIRYTLTIDLRTPRQTANDVELPSLDYSTISSATGFYVAIDADWNQSTSPIVYDATASNFRIYQDTAGHTKLEIKLPNFATQSVLDRLNNGETVNLRCEVAGYTTSGSVTDAIFAFDFLLQVRNRVYLGGTVPAAVSSNPDYLTAAEVQALIAAATANSLSIGTVTSGTAAAATITGTAPNQSLNLVLVNGTNGSNGTTPSIDETTKHWMIGDTDTGVLAQGTNGTSPVLTIDSDGYWCINGTSTSTLARGPQGAGLHYDRSGAITDRSLYDEEDEGFKFATVSVDQTNHSSSITIYTKVSDTDGDWDDGMTYVVFDSSANLNSLTPITFTYQADLDNVYFDLSSYPNAIVTGVEIQTTEGWQLLPYFSAYGIRKMIRSTANRVTLYLGSNIPTWTNMRIYLAQMIANSTSTSGGTASGSTTAQMYYGYISSANAGGVYKVSEVTQAMITAAGSTMHSANSGALAQTSLGTVPAGALIVALVPASSNLIVEKYNGINGFTTFELNNGTTGTGANGTTVTLGGTSYKVYGEFKLEPAADIQIRIRSNS